jgi:ribosome-associated protein
VIPIETQIQPLPSRARAAKPKTPDGYTPETLKDAIIRSLDDDKGADIMFVDLEDKTICDFVVIATGQSSRQVSAMAGHLVDTLQPKMSFRITLEGAAQGDWVLLDCGDVVVHLFRPEVRDFYAIEKMWGLEPPKFVASSDEPAED